MHVQRSALLALCLLLGACSPTTPLFITQLTTNEVVEYKTMKSQRMAAAVEEEGDLLTYSAMAIRDAKSPEAEELYLVGYRDDRFSDDVRAIALYQIGLIYMSRYNDQRDDAKALAYLQRVLDEFPASRAAERAEARILVIRQRAREPVQKTSRELLASWKPSSNLDLYKPGLDPDMTLLSRRAVLKDRVAEAEELYRLALSDDHVQPDIKQKALYQLALMYMAPDNPHASRDKAIGYLRRLLVQFPDSDLAPKASHHLDQILNRNDT
ncbi:tetratricopeptide repeat protein [Pseudomonas sp. LFM046]|uniref:tetratricopeptide repeat protein n=1 Tax=Pseudomonas sp. LFM046 TaxID=1608357 RepID=UPI0005CFEDDD|nr:tetratricopeptide repeat protein [Pseudomonas sp. LFM046]